MINFPLVVQNLLKRRTLTQLADEMGVDGDELAMIARGHHTDPAFSTALRLLNMHARLCEQKHNLETIGVGE